MGPIDVGAVIIISLLLAIAFGTWALFKRPRE
jgi:hypothetical protein